MASIRRISNTFENIEKIGKQINPYSPENVAEYTRSLQSNREDASSRGNEALIKLLKISREEARKEKAKREERLNGIMTANEMGNVERFIEEAYFVLGDEYKNEKAKKLAEEARRLAYIEAMPRVELLTEISVGPLDARENKGLLPKGSLTVIVLKVPKTQSESAREWFQNFISILTRDKIFDQKSTFNLLLESPSNKDEIRIYIEKEYSAIHWKTIKKELEEDIIINDFNYDSLTWDDYPIFQNIENEIFLREKEEEVSIDFINSEAIAGLDENLLNCPINFISTVFNFSFAESNQDGFILKSELDPEDPDYEEEEIVPFIYGNFLKKENVDFNIIEFVKKMNDEQLLKLLKGDISSYYRIENNNYLQGGDSSLITEEALHFIIYKLANKFKNIFKDKTSLKLEKGIFKRLEDEGWIGFNHPTEAPGFHSEAEYISSYNPSSENSVRVFYVKDEECGELISKKKDILNNYLRDKKISFKEITLSDGIVTEPLEGLKRFFTGKLSCYGYQNFILKRFKNKNFLLSYYYDNFLYEKEKIIDEARNGNIVNFVFPKNLNLKIGEGHFVNRQNVLGFVKVNDSTETGMFNMYLNEELKWLESDMLAVGHICENGFRNESVYGDVDYQRIFPTFLFKDKQYFSSLNQINENYDFRFESNFASTLVHEHVHTMQFRGENFYLTNRSNPEKEILFDDEDNEEFEFLSSTEPLKDEDYYQLEETIFIYRKRFYYLLPFINYLMINKKLKKEYENETIKVVQKFEIKNVVPGNGPSPRFRVCSSETLKKDLIDGKFDLYLNGVKVFSGEQNINDNIVCYFGTIEGAVQNEEGAYLLWNSSALNGRELNETDEVLVFHNAKAYSKYKNLEEIITKFETPGLVEGLNRSDFLDKLAEELYYFYKRYMGFFFKFGTSYFSNFINEKILQKEVEGSGFVFINEGLPTYVEKILVKAMIDEVWAGVWPYDLFNDNTVYSYFGGIDKKYLLYASIVSKLDKKIKEKDGSGSSVFDIFTTVNYGEYEDFSAFKEKESINDGVRVKDILYKYEVVPNFGTLLRNNDRFDLFRDEEIANSAENNFRIIYKPVAPTPAIQRAAAPVLTPAAPRPQPTPAQPAPEDPALLETYIRMQEQGAALQGMINQASIDGAQISQETSDAVNTQY